MCEISNIVEMPPSRDLSSTVCVVTGGLGFIGSNVTHELVRQGARVGSSTRLVDGHGGDRRNVDWASDPVEIVEAEIGDPVVADVVADADIIFNLAGQVSHIASMRDPLRDLHLNAITHASFLETLRRVNPTARVVHTSTRQVYGRPLRSPVDELHPTSPMDVNGVAKLAGEQLHLVYHTAYAMPTTSLRLTNVYGPRQRLTSDELGFLPVFIRKALLGEEIRIFGDGAQRRDCVYVDDVVDAILAATAPRGDRPSVQRRPRDRPLAGRDRVGDHRGHRQQRRAAARARGPTITNGSTSVRSTPMARRSPRSSVGRPRRRSTTGFERPPSFYRDHPWYLSST